MNITISNGYINEKWPFSIATLVYQRATSGPMAWPQTFHVRDAAVQLSAATEVVNPHWCQAEPTLMRLISPASKTLTLLFLGGINSDKSPYDQNPKDSMKQQPKNC